MASAVVPPGIPRFRIFTPSIPLLVKIFCNWFGQDCSAVTEMSYVVEPPYTLIMDWYFSGFAGISRKPSLLCSNLLGTKCLPSSAENSVLWAKKSLCFFSLNREAWSRCMNFIYLKVVEYFASCVIDTVSNTSMMPILLAIVFCRLLGSTQLAVRHPDATKNDQDWNKIFELASAVIAASPRNPAAINVTKSILRSIRDFELPVVFWSTMDLWWIKRKSSCFA